MYQIKDGWLVFDKLFNEPLTNVVFPVGIQKIRLSYYFNQYVNNLLPNSLTHLTFGWHFDQDVSKLPNSITHLTFGHHFDQDVSKLPNSLIYLTFDHCFNQETHNLPNSITHLEFGWNFKQDVHNLPNSLTHLTFGFAFNQDVSNLPNSLTHLIFGHYFNQDVSKLPKGITYLKFRVCTGYKFRHNLNPYLYHLIKFYIKEDHKHKSLMLSRCRINKHNISIREDKLIDLLLKN